MKLTHNKLFAVWLIAVSLAISGCDQVSTPINDKMRIQQEIDAKNPNNNQAFCVRVGKGEYYNRDNPLLHTIYQYDLSLNIIKSNYDLRNAIFSNEQQSRFALFAKIGLLIESRNSYGNAYGRKSYSYTLARGSEKSVNWEGGVNFCFGRIVVDEVINTTNNPSIEDSEALKTIHFTYHLDDVPDWMQDESIYSLYASHTDFIHLIQGKQLKGTHTYKVAEDGSLILWNGVRGNRYIL